MASLNKYTGSWSKYLASHLLRRTTYGVKYETIVNFGKQTLDQCVDTLLLPLGDPPPPINYTEPTDPNCPIGQTWVDKGTSENVDAYRNQSLLSWTYDLILKGDANIREKMTVFWHNHFVIADINDARFRYIYISLLRKSALGNFKQLTKDITIDPAMLNYLNGRENTGKAPNENYARELLELFTIGKGPLAGPGDYTNYTEDDIKEMAKVLTGWIDIRATLPIRAQFNAARHDNTTKKLSHRFDNAVINNAGAEEYKNLIDIIFQKEAVAIHIATKLYRWFVKSTIDDDIQTNIIVPLAKIIRDNNYEIKPGIKALISSEHFYEDCIVGSIIKNPIDFMTNPLNQFNPILPTNDVDKFKAYFGLHQLTVLQQMGLFNAPSVAGWQVYYQEPLYYRLWLNATSLPARKNFTDALVSNVLKVRNFSINFNAIETIGKFPNPNNPDVVLEELNLIMYCKPLASNQLTVLKTILDTGNAGNWQKIYNLYSTNPTDSNKTVIVSRLQNLLIYMMRMPEYHLS